MTLKRTNNIFHFSTQVNLVELTGWRAKNLQELLFHLKSAPSAVIYHHTHHFLKQHQFLSPEPPNDFSFWVTNVLQEDALGEKLAAIDTVRFSSIHLLGAKIIEVIENHLNKRGSSRVCPDGEEFHFMKSMGFVLPTSITAADLHEFAEGVAKISHASLYHHIFEARMRLEKANNDFSNWLTNELDEKGLAKSISALDPYTQTLEGLRKKIIALVEDRLAS